ncbi:helix-turn-helix transcriptional regulator [Streptomyces sp. DH12]|uniref:helix-turn-helix transcriptional regulator n=1 Tax=Streptomyces sp. DH12 TaxID=2857010 RepID=UPI001E4FA0A8|nr:helix-turn-helix transcriptional regulator [Streptomyces sp. DH12]
MPVEPTPEVGRRIAVARRARRLSQADLAARAHVSLSMLRKVEQGTRLPGDDTLDAIAAALGLDPGRLLADQTRRDGRVRAALPALSAAIAGYDIPDSPATGPTRDPDELERAAADAERWRLEAQYVRLAQAAPALVADAVAGLHAARGAERERAARVLVSAARSGDAVAYKSGAHDLSARLIDVMRWAAAWTNDPLADATTAYVRTETFFSARAYAAGLRALEHALDQTPTVVDPRTAAARGALHMRAAVIAGRAGDADTAATHLGEARKLADGLREGVYGGTAFGPESVRVHRVSVAVSLGGDHAAGALRLADTWRPSESLPAERRSGYYIELARAQMWCARLDQAFTSLQAARHAAPQHTRGHPWARETAATLRRLRRADAEALTSFAEWIGAV